jgi:hypothetical protein
MEKSLIRKILIILFGHLDPTQNTSNVDHDRADLSVYIGNADPVPGA